MAFVYELLDKARGRLVYVPDDKSLLDVARLLRSGTDIVVMRDSSGKLAGVLTKTDIVESFSLSESLDGFVAASSVMKRDVMSCQVDNDIHALLIRMHGRGLKNVPIIDENGQPIGILNARDALETLLTDTEVEENLLRDYVMGLGYR